MPLHGCKQQHQSQWTMYKKVPVTFHVLGINFVEMNQMGIECESRKPKEQGLVWSYPIAELGIRGSFEWEESVSIILFTIRMNRRNAHV